MKKHFTEEQIIGFLREAEAGLPIKELCRQHGFSEAVTTCGAASSVA
jgi:putative transposase